MRRFFPNRGLAAALAIILSTTTLSAARADTADYEFRLVQTDVKQGDGAVVAVRLVDKRSGAAIPDAVIFATRIDMAPEGMRSEEHTSELQSLMRISYAVFCLKKKKNTTTQYNIN